MYGDTPLKGNVPVTSTLIERTFVNNAAIATLLVRKANISSALG